MTDIGDDPDDEQSMVRLMAYANEFRIEGLMAVTSVYHPSGVRPDLVHRIVGAYGAVQANLAVHAPGFPDAASLQARVIAGGEAYGMAGVGKGHDTPASRWIVRTVDGAKNAGTADPVWFLIWGGAHDLAQALWSVRATRSPAATAKFVSRIRAYSISEQDDAGPWMRRQFPGLFWIASVHAAWQYPSAAWTGMGGDRLFDFTGTDPSLIAPEWIDRNVRIGPLGAVYPPVKFAMEGDTPSILYLLPTGLSDPEHPEWGGWGGRYGLPLGDARAYADAEDRVIGSDGKPHRGNPETVWRWRAAVQADFAARMRWTMTPRFADADHAPTILINGTPGPAPLMLTARGGTRIALSSAGSTDPDGDRLLTRWFAYPEPTGGYFNPPLAFTAEEGESTTVTLPAVTRPLDYHIVLEVREDRPTPLVRYRRAIVHVTP